MATKKTTEDRLAELKERQAKLKEQEKRIKAKATAEKRKADTRLKIEIGGIVQKYLGRPLEESDKEKLAAFLQGQENRGHFFTDAMNGKK